MSTKAMPTADVIEQSMRSVKRMGFGGGLYVIRGQKEKTLYWRLDYAFESIRKTISLGVFPGVSPERASQLAIANLALVKDGINPSDLRKANRRNSDESQFGWTMRKYAVLHPASFQSVANDWLNAAELLWSDKYREVVRGRIDNHILSSIGHKLLSEITSKNIYDLCLELVNKGSRDTARRVCGICEQVISHGIVLGHAEVNPCPLVLSRLPKVKTKHFAAITNPSKLAILLSKIHKYHGSIVVVTALKLLPLLLVRPGNLQKARWDQFDLNLGWWLIPSEELKGSKERKKNPESHAVPLASQAIEMLRKLYAATAPTGVLFPGRGVATHMSENTMNKALKTMGFSTLTEITGHGFRAIARTLIEQELKLNSALAEIQLDHTVKDPNGRAYNRTSMLNQRKEMMQQWADYLDRLRLGEIVYENPLEGFTPIALQSEFPSPPAARIDISPVRKLQHENSQIGIGIGHDSVRKKSETQLQSRNRYRSKSPFRLNLNIIN